MTDIRKMLELAAKAMGRKIPTPRQYPWAWINDDGIHENISEDGSRVKTWAPHVDDGDNSRMRTKLRIDALWVYAENGDAVGVECSVMRHHGDRFFTMRARWIEMLADHNNDPDAALRLCALRVAAAIGEQM